MNIYSEKRKTMPLLFLKYNVMNILLRKAVTKLLNSDLLKRTKAAFSLCRMSVVSFLGFLKLLVNWIIYQLHLISSVLGAGDLGYLGSIPGLTEWLAFTLGEFGTSISPCRIYISGRDKRGSVILEILKLCSFLSGIVISGNIVLLHTCYILFCV